VRVESPTLSLAIRPAAQWLVSNATSDCSATCGTGVQSRSVSCTSNIQPGAPAADALCAAYSSRPPTTVACFGSQCRFAFFVGDYTPCSASCGPGLRTRVVQCRNSSGLAVADTSLCGAIAPASSLVCNDGPCDSYRWQYSDYSVCTVSCGGGARYRSALCVSELTGTPVATSRCASLPMLGTAEVCNTPVCASLYRWEVASEFGECTMPCGGGISARSVLCRTISTGTVVPDILCANIEAALKPAPTRSCNTRPCVSYAYDVTEWSACNSTSCGWRERDVRCVSINSTSATPATATVVVNQSLCDAAGLLKPTAAEACLASCFCETTQCSGRGQCNATLAACMCEAGYSGVYCERAAGCDGPSSRTGACCPAGAVLDGRDECCRSGQVDGNGTCCPSGSIVNKCGVCGGPAAAIVSPTGECCANGVTGADGLCCNGVLDSFGTVLVVTVFLYTVAVASFCSCN
jgi:hypothetical protein